MNKPRLVIGDYHEGFLVEVAYVEATESLLPPSPAFLNSIFYATASALGFFSHACRVLEVLLGFLFSYPQLIYPLEFYWDLYYGLDGVVNWQSLSDSEVKEAFTMSSSFGRLLNKTSLSSNSQLY